MSEEKLDMSKTQMKKKNFCASFIGGNYKKKIIIDATSFFACDQLGK